MQLEKTDKESDVMKRIVSIILIVVTAFALFGNFASAESTDAKADEYELWAQSPYLTTSVGREEFRIYKAMEMKMLKMYPLPNLGERYFFAIAESRIEDSGSSGRTDLSIVHCFLLLALDDGFMIIDYCEPLSDYYWDEGAAIADVSSLTTPPAEGARALYVIRPNGRYNSSSWDNYNDYMIITDEKRMVSVIEDNCDGCAGWPIIYEGKVYWGASKYVSGGYVKTYYNNTLKGDAFKLCETVFSQDEMVKGASTLPLQSTVTEANGYYSYSYDNVDADIPEIKVYKIPNSDNLYFKYSQSRPSDSSYYQDQIEIVKNNNGIFKTIKTYSFNSGMTVASNYTATELLGIDADWYTNNGYSVPALAVSNKYIITNTGVVAQVSLDTKYKSWNYALYNDRLVIIRNQNNYSYVSEYIDGKTVYKQMLNYVNISNQGELLLDEDILLNQVTGGNTGQDGYYYSMSTFEKCSTFKSVGSTSVKEWWGRFEDNVFDDGRTVECDWRSVGGYYEMWYTITDANGRDCAKGPTGYTARESIAEYDCFCVAIGNSKFIAGVMDVHSNVTNEYYRASVVKENGDGNVSSSTSIGSKTLTPPKDADTVPVQSVIDFGQDNLPIGYNIRDNVISSAKLDSAVREQINAIRLNDIVIVKNTETSSGVQNSGITLAEYEGYDSAMGEEPVVIYTNGQNFCWYCNDIDSLNNGTYNRNYTIGDKVIYVTFKIVEAPDNDGITTVVF